MNAAQSRLRDRIDRVGADGDYAANNLDAVRGKLKAWYDSQAPEEQAKWREADTTRATLQDLKWAEQQHEDAERMRELFHAKFAPAVLAKIEDGTIRSVTDLKAQLTLWSARN